MFTVSEEEAAAIRAVFDRDSEVRGCRGVLPMLPVHPRQ
jgi:hypothetical protein